MEVDGTFQHLRGHVPPCAHLAVSVSSGLSGVEDQGKAKVSNASSQIILQQDVLAFEVSVCDGRLEGLTPGGRLLLMDVHQPTGHRLPNLAQLGPGHKIGLEIVAQGTPLMV